MAKGNGSKGGGGKPPSPMTTQAAGRIQSANAPKTGGRTAAGSFPARAQSAAAKNSGGKK